MDKISLHDVINRYERMDEIWPATDAWHFYTGKVIHSTVNLWVLESKKNDDVILNVGSGGSTYGLADLNFIHGDICIRNLSAEDSVVCNVERLPFQDETFDMVICVGSVINYCDALIALGELARVLKPFGTLIIEFEKSDNFEFIFSKNFCANAIIVTAQYDGDKERVWVYNERYIKNLLNTLRFVIQRRRAIHTLSSAMLRVLPSPIAAKFGSWDWILSRLPLFNQFASNVILECKKIE